MLDNHVSVKQLMSKRSLKDDSVLNICVLKCTWLFKKAHAAFDQGRGFERGEGRDFAISSDSIFLTYML